MAKHAPLDLDWDGAVARASEDGCLMALLGSLPRAQWSERGPGGTTLLHSVCYGNNVTAAMALLGHGLCVDARDNNTDWCPSHTAAVTGQAHVLEVLCAAGADLRARDKAAHAPLEYAIPRTMVPVLLANGVRLNTVHVHFRRLITPEMAAFERGVLRCRSAVVTLLGLKRRRGE